MYEPERKDKFTFGLWTVGNPGADPFGPAVRPKFTPVEIVENLARLNVWGVSFHDEDLIPIDRWNEHDRIVSEFKKALDANGMVVSMATVNLFTHPIFRDGAHTSPDVQVRRFALQKTLNAIDLGVELGTKLFVMWGGREGTECDAGKDPIEALKRYREGLNYITHYIKDRGYDMRVALEAKPNEPRGDIYLSTNGAMLAFIETLDHPEMVGVNPEVAHEVMAGLNFYHVLAQSLECGKLFHVDLNAQKIGRYDQDLRFGSEDIKNAFYCVRLLESGLYDGPRQFDAHAYRTEDPEGVWDFAAGCMRTYKILKEKAKQFDADSEIQGLIRRYEPTPAYSNADAEKLKTAAFDIDALAAKGAMYEKLDQLVVELLLGAR